jgi:hypothetical protein
MSEFKNITVSFKVKTTTLKVVKAKLQILNFIKLNKRQPSVNSDSKKEVKLAWKAKNYTNKLLPCYDPLFANEIGKAEFSNIVRMKEEIAQALDQAEAFVKANGFREIGARRGENGDHPCFIRLSFVNYNQKIMKENNWIDRLEKIKSYPTKYEFEMKNKRLAAVRFITDYKRLPNSANGSYEDAIIKSINNAFYSPTKYNLKFRQVIKQLAKKLKISSPVLDFKK